MTSQQLNELAQRVHKANEKWWTHPVTKERVERNRKELMMLVITELSEACEGERKNLMDDKLPHRKMAEVEMADAMIRLLDIAKGYRIPIIIEMIEYQEVESHIPDNKGEALLIICANVIGYEMGRCEFGYILQMIEDYCIKHSYDLYGALEEKMAYNVTRVDHTHEARLQADGKKW